MTFSLIVMLSPTAPMFICGLLDPKQTDLSPNLKQQPLLKNNSIRKWRHDSLWGIEKAFSRFSIWITILHYTALHLRGVFTAKVVGTFVPSADDEKYNDNDNYNYNYNRCAENKRRKKKQVWARFPRKRTHTYLQLEEKQTTRWWYQSYITKRSTP